jgi:hypothetical protein
VLRYDIELAKLTKLIPRISHLSVILPIPNLVRGRLAKPRVLTAYFAVIEPRIRRTSPPEVSAFNLVVVLANALTIGVILWIHKRYGSKF